VKRAVSLLLLIACVAPACGKKGPPRAPLRLVPAAATGLEPSRRGDDVQLKFTVPAANQGGQGTLDLERLEIYAITLAPDAPVPANRELLSKRFLAGTIDVKPVAPATEAPPPSQSKPEGPPVPVAPDTRPAPGAPAMFVETLTKEKLEPVVLQTEVAPTVAPPAATTTATPATPPAPKYIRRVYTIRGVTRSGRPGPPSARVEVPLVDPPPAPTSAQAEFTETAVTIAWLPPVAASADAPAFGFNVYKQGSPSALNSALVTGPRFEREGLEFGTEECFVVRTVQTIAGVTMESAPSEPSCVTPIDTFAPGAPKGLSAVAGTGVINLIWDANSEGDLAGYQVLRGEAPGDTLQALTPEPIKETSFRDTTVTPGVRYVYAVVAVDRSTPPNRSAHSLRVEETAR
jgi:hypothetical protein